MTLRPKTRLQARMQELLDRGGEDVDLDTRWLNLVPISTGSSAGR